MMENLFALLIVCQTTKPVKEGFFAQTGLFILLIITSRHWQGMKG